MTQALLAESMGRSCDAEHFVYRNVYGAVTRLRELRIGTAVVWERRDLLVTARFASFGDSEVPLLDLMLRLGSMDIAKEFVNFAVTVLQPSQYWAHLDKLSHAC